MQVEKGECKVEAVRNQTGVGTGSEAPAERAVLTLIALTSLTRSPS